MKGFFRIIMILLVLIVCSCDEKSSEETSEIMIREKLDEIELAFNLHHIEEIMEYYSGDYMHNGDDRDDVRLDWEIRLNDYYEMELDEIEVEVDVELAIVSMQRCFTRDNLIEELSEPADNGDLSYWELGVDGWVIAGNKKLN